MDRALEFYIREYQGIKALLELQEHAEARLPHEIIKLLYDALKSNCNTWNWGASADGVSVYKSNNGVQWYDRNWLNPRDDDTGLYFGIGNLTASSVIELEDDDDRPDLFLYHDARVGNLTAAALTQAFTNARSALQRQLQGLHINEQDKDGISLAWLSLGETITVESLKDRDAMLQEFLKKAQMFTEALAPIAYRVAQGI